MADEFDFQKLKSEYYDFFSKIPASFLNFVFSEETISKIAQICVENEVIEEEQIEKVAYRLVLALFGQIPKENLPEILTKGAGISPISALYITKKAEDLIFSQVPKIETEEFKEKERKIKTIGEILGLKELLEKKKKY